VVISTEDPGFLSTLSSSSSFFDFFDFAVSILHPVLLSVALVWSVVKNFYAFILPGGKSPLTKSEISA
jgi:hypothetical protein